MSAYGKFFFCVLLLFVPVRADIFENYWTAIQSLDFEAVEANIPLNRDVDEDYKKFMWAMQLTVAGDVELAQKIMNELALNSEDSLIKHNAVVVLSQLWFLQDRWQAFVEAQRYLGRTRENTFALVSAFAEAPSEIYDFPEDEVKLPFGLSITGCPIVKVEINGKKRRLWLDTGASTTALTSDLAKELGVEKIGNDTISFFTGTTKMVKVQPAMIDNLKIGRIKIRNHPAVIMNTEDLELNFFGLTIIKVDGIIGYNLIKNMDVIIDYSRRSIMFSEPEKRDQANRNFFWLGGPIVRLTSADGDTLNFFTDTGASRTSLFEKSLNKIAPGQLEETGAIIGSAGGSQRFKTVSIDELTLRIDNESLTFNDLIVGFATIQPFINLDGILGADAFSNRVVHIDHTNGIFEISSRR